MRICFPVEVDRGHNSVIASNFSSAPIFIVIDTELDSSSAVTNSDPDRPEGSLNPFKALNRRVLDGIVVDGVGDETVLVMNMAGHRMFQAVSSSVSENIELFVQSRLPEIQVMNSYVEGRYYDASSELVEPHLSAFPRDRERQR
jgi:predicted Fe-Mo cluster-binding NifX family protein